MKTKIGLLLPRSVIYPSMSFDLMGGLRAILQILGADNTEVKTESIGLAADDKGIYTACEKLLFDGVRIIAGYVNPASAEKLEPLFAGANATFIALDAGMHFPTSTAALPHVYYLSLQGALCARALMRSAVFRGHSHMAFVGSFYDAGYRVPYACHRGVEDAGGKITFNLITPLKRSEFSLDRLEDHLKTGEGEAVFASFCGDMLQDFFAAMASKQILSGRTVYGSLFVGDEQWLAKIPYPGVDVRVCVPWATTLQNEENLRFVATLTDKKTNVNLFSLLGWEFGLVAAAAGSGLATLAGYSFNSPRGMVTIDKDTHLCHAPLYDGVVKKDGAGNCRLEISGDNPHAVDQRTALEKDINTISGSVTSWFNAYGCIES